VDWTQPVAANTQAGGRFETRASFSAVKLTQNVLVIAAVAKG